MFYTFLPPYASMKRTCLACDWENGYGLVSSGYCVKSTDSKCFVPSTYLYDYSSLNNIAKIFYIPCIICVEGYVPDF